MHRHESRDILVQTHLALLALTQTESLKCLATVTIERVPSLAACLFKWRLAAAESALTLLCAVTVLVQPVQPQVMND